MANNFFHEYPYTNFHELNLDWILKKINEFQEKLDAWSVLAEELQTALEGIDGMKADILQLQQDFAEYADLSAQVRTITALALNNERNIEVLSAKVDAIQPQIDNLIIALRNQATVLRKEMAAMELDIKNDYNAKFFELRRIIDYINWRLDQIDTRVINPWHSELGRISPDYNSKLTYGDLANECPTAEEYLKLGLSASDYAAFDLSAINYARFGKIRLHYYWVYMPVEGTRQDISNVLTSIVNNIMGTMTADDYADLDIDADAFAALDLTAAQYLMYPLNSIGLTADDYAGIGTLNSGLLFNFN